MASGQSLALFCLGLILLAAEVTSQRRCSVPAWDSSLGPNPVASHQGKVVVVALFAGYCSYCVDQAVRLNRLREHLISQGITEVEMVIINSGIERSRENVDNLRVSDSIPVIQDTHDEIMFREVFRGSKDDFIVYDRCGQRVAFIPHPYSYLGHTITERVIRAVHSGRSRICHCSHDVRNHDPYDVMYGDQPMGPSYGVVQSSDTRLDLNCMEGDSWCRRFQRNFRRFQWDRSGSNRNSMYGYRMSNRPRLRAHQEQHEVEGYHSHHEGESHQDTEGHHGHEGGRGHRGHRGQRGHRGHNGHGAHMGRHRSSFGGPM